MAFKQTSFDEQYPEISGYPEHEGVFLPSQPELGLEANEGEIVEYKTQFEAEEVEDVEEESKPEKYEEFGVLYGYFRDIAKEPLLSAREETEIAAKMKHFEVRANTLRVALDKLPKEAKDELTAKRIERLNARREGYLRRAQELKQRFVNANLRLVIKIARRYMGRGLPFSDLIQEGNSGLIKAVERFDHTKGFKFSTYAVWWIQQAVVRALLEQTKTIKVPVYLLEKSSRVYAARSAMEKELGRKPTHGEIAKEISKEVGISADQVREILKAKEDVASLDVPVRKGEGATFLDFVPDQQSPSAESLMAGESLTERMREAFAILSPREEEVLKMRFGIDREDAHTLEEIGSTFGLSRERIRQIEKEALRKIAVSKTGRELRSFLES